VAHLRLGGLRGKESTPSVWLGGTSESSMVGKQEQKRQEHKNHLLQAIRAQVCKYLGVYVFLCVFINCSLMVFVQIYSFSGYLIFWHLLLSISAWVLAKGFM